MSTYFDAKDPADAVTLTFDYTLDLPSGVTLSGTPSVMSVKTFSGTDSQPNLLLNGEPTIDPTSTKVLLPVSGGNAGCTYEFCVQCPTTNPYLILTWVALLPVAR